MATKQKHRTKQGAAGLPQQARRSLEKGDFKQALKDAKLWYRQTPDPEARQVLERAYLARGRQLYRAGLQDQAQVVVEDLLALGATEPSVEQELPKLLIALGLFNRVAAIGGARTPLEENSPLYIAAADHAVLRPEKAPASFAAIRQGAGVIRQALAALEASDESTAMAVLKDIARASPFADWKYFVRGLAAYYRQEAAEMQANWDRLDPARFASRIAASLKVLADPAVVSTDDFHATHTIARLGSAVMGGPILARLQALQTHVTEGRWREAVKLLRADHAILRQIDPALPGRLAGILYEAMINRGNPAALPELAAVIEPLPIDPKMNRGIAMAWEHLIQEGGDSRYDDEEIVRHIERHWRAYLDDLVQLECLLPAERTLAQALAWQHLGRMLALESAAVCPTCHVCHEPDEELRIRAIDYFEKALSLSPELRLAYLDLAVSYRQWDDPEHAAATWRRLLDRFPEDLDALLSLAEHHIQSNEPFEAVEFLCRAERLKPLNLKIKSMLLAVRLGAARRHGQAGRREEGRAELAVAEKMDVPDAVPFHLTTCQAAFELKADNPDLAQRLLDRACKESGEAAPIWLLMTIECQLYAMPKTVTDDFEHRWTTSLKKSCRGAVAGAMCRMLSAFIKTEADYAGHNALVVRLVEFLAGCKRIRAWQADELHQVLEFLILCIHHEHSRENSFRKKTNLADILQASTVFADKARLKFPEHCHLQLQAGEIEISKGPVECNRDWARLCFVRVIRLAEESNDPNDAKFAMRARESLDFLDQADQMHGAEASPFSPPVDQNEDDDDFFSNPFEYGESDKADDGRPSLSFADLPAEVVASLERLCREMNVDMGDALKELGVSDDLPFQFKADKGPAKKKKKRK